MTTTATPPRLEACIFNDDRDGQWPRLARVLSYGAARHCPGWDIHVRHVLPARMVSALGIQSHVANTQKMEHWYQLVSQAEDGERLLLMDADTMVLRSLDDVWDRDFDLAYTTKDARFPFNSGVVFVRVSERLRAFVSAWRDENRRMLGDREHHQVWRRQYGGINQAALGYMLAQGDRHGIQLAQLPCLEWNCEDSGWAAFDPAVTRIVHIKSGLRRAIFLRTHVSHHVAPLVKIWRSLEQDALEAGRQAARQHPAETPAPPPAAPTVPASLIASRPAPLRPRGRPRGDGTVVTTVKIPQRTYDAYCRRAIAERKSLHGLVRETLEAHVP